MMDDIFGDIIHAYTRAEAIEDGTLVDVSVTAREAGFRWPVALTRAAWADCVSWPTDESTYQDEAGRLWDVLWMAFVATRRTRPDGREMLFQLRRIPRGGQRARTVTLKMVSGPGDDGEPTLTIMLPEED